MAFAGITAALFATATRAAVAGLLLGCVASLLLLGTRRVRDRGDRHSARDSRRRDPLDSALATDSSGSDRSDVGTHFRVLMWEDGIRLVREHPWFGVGMETVRVHYREWNIRGFIQYNVQSHFHSTFLQIAVERGIPALLAWLWFCVAYFVFLCGSFAACRTQNRFACGVAVGALAAFARV